MVGQLDIDPVGCVLLEWGSENWSRQTLCPKEEVDLGLDKKK